MSEEKEIQNATPELLKRLKNARPIPGFAFPGRVGIPGTDVSVVPGSGLHAFTDTELARLVAVACREQRYACVDELTGTGILSVNVLQSNRVQNAPAPSLEHVMKKYEELKES